MVGVVCDVYCLEYGLVCGRGFEVGVGLEMGVGEMVVVEVECVFGIFLLGKFSFVFKFLNLVVVILYVIVVFFVVLNVFS